MKGRTRGKKKKTIKEGRKKGRGVHKKRREGRGERCGKNDEPGRERKKK